MSAASQIREAALRGDRSASRRQAVTFLLLLGCPTRTMSVCTAPRQQAPMPRPRPQWVGWQTTSGLADWQTGRLADWVSKGYVPLVCGVRPARCVGATRSSRVGNGDLHLSCAPSLSVSPHHRKLPAARFGTAPCRDANVTPLPARRQPVSHPF